MIRFILRPFKLCKPKQDHPPRLAPQPRENGPWRGLCREASAWGVWFLGAFHGTSSDMRTPQVWDFNAEQQRHLSGQKMRDGAGSGWMWGQLFTLSPSFLLNLLPA